MEKIHEYPTTIITYVFGFLLFCCFFFLFPGSKYLVAKSREASVFSMLIQTSPTFLEGFQEVVEGIKSPESV